LIFNLLKSVTGKAEANRHQANRKDP
jgi:hypothetical protein